MFLKRPEIQTAGGGQSVSLILLSLGLVFSVATQLRLPGLPLGLGESLLLLWLLATLVTTRKWHNLAMVGVLSLTVVGALLLGAGYFLTSYPAGQSRPPALHDMLAYAFCAVLAINYAGLHNQYESSLPAALLRAFLLSALLALVLGVIAKEWSGLDAIYYPSRWQHLSNNPNQFALLALPLPFLTLHLILRQHKKQNLLVPTIACLLALALGLYSQSDALTLAWIGGGLVAALALLRKHPKTFMPTPARHPAPHARRIAALLIMLMVAASAWQWRDIPAEIIMGAGADLNSGLPQSPSDADQNQASVRFGLWRNGLAAIQYAPLTGMGPGPHSGFIKPFDGEEAQIV